MSNYIQSQAVKIIELIAQRLDPLFKRSDFHNKFRESDPSVFAEALRYEKEGIELRISACLHPHDYPYSLDVQFIDKNCSPWNYINQRELVEMAQKFCGVPKTDLLIATDFEVLSTVEELYEIMKCILENTF